MTRFWTGLAFHIYLQCMFIVLFFWCFVLSFLPLFYRPHFPPVSSLSSLCLFTLTYPTCIQLSLLLFPFVYLNPPSLQTCACLLWRCPGLPLIPYSSCSMITWIIDLTLFICWIVFFLLDWQTNWQLLMRCLHSSEYRLCGNSGLAMLFIEYMLTARSSSKHTTTVYISSKGQHLF